MIITVIADGAVSHSLRRRTFGRGPRAVRGQAALAGRATRHITRRGRELTRGTTARTLRRTGGGEGGLILI